MVKWLGLLLMVIILAACSGGEQPGVVAETGESISIEGPALVMFYTDN